MRGRRYGALVWLGSLILLAGCSTRPTEYLLHIESNIPGDTLRAINVLTWATADTTKQDVATSSCFCLGPSCRELPVTMALLPTSDPHRRFEVEVRGYGVGSINCVMPLLTRNASLQFVPEQSLDVYMDLTAECLGVVCDPVQTCVGGVCVDPVMGGTVTTPDGGQVVQIDMSPPPDAYAPSDDMRTTCFVAGTPVRLASGQRQAIERIEIGELVNAVEERTQWSPVVPRPASVVGTTRHQVNEVLAVTVEGVEVLVTAEHPFAVIGRGFVNAGDLAVGDPLLRSNGRGASVQHIERRQGRFPVYNLEVDGDHTYFVSDLELVVHNKVPICF